MLVHCGLLDNVIAQLVFNDFPDDIGGLTKVVHLQDLNIGLAFTVL